MIRIAILLVALAAGFPAQEAPLDLFVAPDGDDGWTGRSARHDQDQGPVRTLARARDALRAIRRADPSALAGGCVVHLAAGTWRERIDLSSEDSGSPDAPIRWVGAGASATIVSGGIPLTEWKPWREAIRSCALRGKRPKQLFCAGARQDLARYPNRDRADRHGGAWAHVAAVDSDGEFLSFHHGGGERHTWSHPEDASVAIFSGFDWAFRILPLASYDPTTRTITLGAKTWCPLRPGDRYLIEGLLEDLDAPGEWCVDARADALVWWPPAGADPAQAEIGGAGPVVRLLDAHDVVVSDLTVGGCDGDAVRIDGGRSCAIERCAIRACGGNGVVIAGGSRHAVLGCDVSGAGEGGISASGGDPKAITAGPSAGFTATGGHMIADNDVHDCGQVWRTYRPAISVTGVGNTIAHNHVHDLPHAGITFSGNEHVVEFNHVHHVNNESADTGGLYFCSRDWMQRGSVVRYNSFHDCGGYGKESAWQPVRDGAVRFTYPAFTWGVYLDDPSCGTRVIGNIFDRVPVCAMHNHGGSDNLWANNIVIDCTAINVGTLAHDWDAWPKIIAALRSAVGGSPDILERYPELRRIDVDRPERVSGVRFERNIVVVTAAGTAALRAQHPDWHGCLPIYQISLGDDDLSGNVWDANCLAIEPGVDGRVQFRRTVAGKPGQIEFLTWDAWRALGQDARSRLADPGFTDFAARNLSLRADSAARDLGFEPIPIEQIGPRQHPSWRAEGPVEEPLVQRFVLDASPTP